jgi:hypothetical protein
LVDIASHPEHMVELAPSLGRGTRHLLGARRIAAIGQPYQRAFPRYRKR